MSEVENFRKSLMDKFEKLKDKAEDLRDILYLDGVLAVIQTHGKSGDDILKELNLRKVIDLKWYTLPPETSNYGTTVDWNQTLATSINQVAANLFKERNGEAVNETKILVPETFKRIFNTLAYYNSSKGLLSDKFVVEFDDQIDALYIIENKLYGKINLIDSFYE